MGVLGCNIVSACLHGPDHRSSIFPVLWGLIINTLLSFFLVCKVFLCVISSRNLALKCIYKCLIKDSKFPPLVIVIDTLKVYSISRKVEKSLGIGDKCMRQKYSRYMFLDKSMFIFNTTILELFYTSTP